MLTGITGKLVAGSIALAVTATGSIVLNKHLEPKTIGKELYEQDKKSLLNKSYGEWSKLIQKYSTTTQDANLKKIKDWELPTDKEESKIPSFISKCSELWNTKLNDISPTEDKERIKEELRNWCVNDPKALKEQ